MWVLQRFIDERTPLPEGSGVRIYYLQVDFFFFRYLTLIICGDICLFTGIGVFFGSSAFCFFAVVSVRLDLPGDRFDLLGIRSALLG